MSVIGLDLSLRSTGLARIKRNGDAYTWVVKSTGTRADTLLDRATRIRSLAAEIAGGVSDDDELAVIESPSFGSTGSGTWDRSGLWWSVVLKLTARDVPIAMVAPTTLKRWIAGDGRADKKAVQSAVEALFPDVKVKTNDESDALALAHCGAFYREFVNIPLVENRHTVQAMAAVKWPALEEN